ncbi:hypothetical protein FKM82_007581 [Ascaphus truei]
MWYSLCPFVFLLVAVTWAALVISTGTNTRGGSCCVASLRAFRSCYLHHATAPLTVSKQSWGWVTVTRVWYSRGLNSSPQ